MTTTTATAHDSGDVSTSGTAVRLLAAAAVLVGGLVHIQLYFRGYRSLPDANLGRSFMVNGVASIAVAGALLWRRDAAVRLAGLAVSLGTLGAFALSRRGDGIFGLRESGLQPSPQAAVALIAELAALALLASTFLRPVGSGRALPRRAVLAGSAAAALLTAAFTIMWVRDGSPASAAAAPATPGAVTIVNFAFDAPELTVPAGTTVTWTNADGFAHSVVSRDESFKSDPLPTGESFTHTFDAAGTFAYICGIHPSMAGTVVVTG